MPAPWWLAVGIAVVVATTAWNTGHLHPDGALAAAVVGTLVFRAQLSWAALLIVWFVATSLVSRIGRVYKWQRTAHMIEKTDQRDAGQVMANGGVYMVLACVVLWWSGGGNVLLLEKFSWLSVAAAGALSAAAADTFATEIGTLSEREPWSLREWKRVPTGSSGAISSRGVFASVAGAVLVACCAWLVGMFSAPVIVPVAVAGILGSLGDTIIGAWWQERRWCAECQRITERQQHDCGALTSVQGGLSRLNNDAVNFVCTLIGASFAVIVAEPVSKMFLR